MSAKHPIIAVTGSSGAGRSVVIDAFAHIMTRQQASWTVIDGNGFHRYDREQFARAVEEASASGRTISHFAPEANQLDRLEALLGEYGERGTGMHRRYIRDQEEAEACGQKPGSFSEWEPLPEGTDLLFYRGLHGCFASNEVDISRYMDLKIGVVPIVNLEWIQKIHRDTRERGYSAEAVNDTILRRLSDYLHYITPQFSRTDINFQRVPTVDTSNPFAARDVPTLDESVFVVRFRNPARFGIDFPKLLNTIKNSFMSRRNTIVVPGGQLGYAIEVILEPIVHDILERRQQAA